MTYFVGKMIFSLMVYTLAFVCLFLAELIFETKISFMLKKALSRPPGSALFSISDTCSYKINPPDMKASM